MEHEDTAQCWALVSSEHMTPEQVLGTGQLLATTTRVLNTHMLIQTETSTLREATP